MSEIKLAHKVAEQMMENTQFEHQLGIELLDADEGFAKMQMKVGKSLLNSKGTCQSGAIFSFADATFSIASNSRNVSTIADSCDISFVRPAYEEDTLIATATEKYIKDQNGIYDIVVVNQKYESVAFFTGKSVATKELILKEG